ncbi:Glu/Leu/Phe/Val dehydrogenase [Oceaniserpentilla sp. 4NH20-0058]|uniref:Leu/Phe/Val dehydrogenase n=1 Tax=Oceaniserpentilla sp. 4NH20-0058 TaxID=3127660 RepID=UPI003105A3B5
MFSSMHAHSVQELHFCQKESLNAVVALHNLRLGPALGGCRFIEYSSEQDAIEDAMRLAKGMTYKAALARVPHGGGKAVIMKPQGEFDREHLFKLFGQFVETLGGRYISAMDSGTQVSDMDVMRAQTTFVSSSSNIGDPSPSTAYGMLLGVECAVRFKMNQSLSGVTVAIQGLGHVGFALADHLHKAGCKLIVCDVDEQKTQLAQQLFNAKVVSVDDIYSQVCDVYSPCGLGGAINAETVGKLNCKIIAGCANNQLAQDELALTLHDMGILYAPDYVINSGGLVFASSCFRGMGHKEIEREIHKLKDTLNKIFVLSKQKNAPCNFIANEMAEQILYGSNQHRDWIQEAV